MKVIAKKGATRHHQDADTQRLMRLVNDNRYSDVERVAREMLARNGKHPLALRALTFALVALGKCEEVIAIADYALGLAPSDGEIHNNRAIALSLLMRWDEAIADFQAALKYAATDFAIHMNLGTAYFRMHRWNDAVPPLLKAIEHHPHDYVEAIQLLALALTNAGRHDEAAVCLNALYASNPESFSLLYSLVSIDLLRCSWDGMSERVEMLRGMPIEGAPNPWWANWLWCFGAKECAELSRGYVVNVIPADFLEPAAQLPMSWRPGARRLRVAYLSADFRAHPVGIVIAEMIERHDRERIELFAYSIGPDDQSSQRERLVRGFEHFTDIVGLSPHMTAERIRADEVDILVDLTGWTANGRVESLALRCAPIQVNWLGYAGTLGHPKLADYIIGDREVTPLGDQEYFAETIMQMPGSYMPTDSTRVIGPAPTRQSQGLPDGGFVMCSFNNIYKFNPPTFDLWCRLLAEMPEAVLWLPRHNDAFASNLLNEVARRGIDRNRLVLAQQVESAQEHLGRLQLADLSLDTFPYNSHSTGVDVLWAGVPMVAKRGVSFAGRVGASLLAAAGLSELIAADDDEYANIVLDLYRDRQRLASLRERLREARDTAPLFDMVGFARDLENLYLDMAERSIASAESRAQDAEGVPRPQAPATMA